MASLQMASIFLASLYTGVPKDGDSIYGVPIVTGVPIYGVPLYKRPCIKALRMIGPAEAVAKRRRSWCFIN